MTGILFTVGLFCGSFLNVLIDRLPKGEDIVWGRSHCDYCKKLLRWFELVPIISYIVQAGRCRRCRKRLSVQYPLVELATGFIFALAAFQYSPVNMLTGEYISMLGNLLAACSLLVIFVSDLKYQIIPDSMIIVGIAGILLQGQAFDARQGQNMWLSALGASIFFLLLFLITRGRGLGLGDVKLAFVLGLLLGYPMIISALYLAFLTGAGVGVILMVTGKKSLKSRIAFGPFLIWGTFAAVVYGEKLMYLWQKLM